MTGKLVVEGRAPVPLEVRWRLELPPGPAPSAGFPVACALHGFADDGSRLAERLAGLAGCRFARLYPDAPFPVSVGEGSRRRLGRSWYAYDGDQAAFARALAEGRMRLEALLDSVFRAQPLDPRRVALIGYSQGGYLGSYVALTRPERFRALVAVACRIKVELLEEHLGGLAGYPVLVVHGARDRAVAPEPQLAAADRLESAGLRVRRHVHARGHGLSPELATPLAEFLEEHLVG